MKYKTHEFGVESPAGYLLENTEDCLEEMNELLRERNEAREFAEWMREMIDPFAECDGTSFPWDNKDV